MKTVQDMATKLDYQIVDDLNNRYNKTNNKFFKQWAELDVRNSKTDSTLVVKINTKKMYEQATWRSRHVDFYYSLSMFNDEQVLDKYDEARTTVSYYNAAEGQYWSMEASGRNEAYNRLTELKKEIDKRGLVPNKGEYLC